MSQYTHTSCQEHTKSLCYQKHTEAVTTLRFVDEK